MYCLTEMLEILLTILLKHPSFFLFLLNSKKIFLWQFQITLLIDFCCILPENFIFATDTVD